MLNSVFIWFRDQENIGIDRQIMILHEVISEILKIFWKMAEVSTESHLFFW